MRSHKRTALPEGSDRGVSGHREGAAMSVPAVLAPVTAAERHKRAIPRGLAATHMLAADRIMAEAAYDAPLTGTDLDVSRFQAQAVRERGLIPMSPDMVVIGVGGELVPTDSGKG